MKNLQKLLLTLAFVPMFAFSPINSLAEKGDIQNGICSVGTAAAIERYSVEDFTLQIPSAAYFGTQNISGLAMFPTLLPPEKPEATKIGVAMLPTLLPPLEIETSKVGVAMFPTLLPPGRTSSVVRLDCVN